MTTSQEAACASVLLLEVIVKEPFATVARSVAAPVPVRKTSECFVAELDVQALVVTTSVAELPGNVAIPAEEEPALIAPVVAVIYLGETPK